MLKRILAVLAAGILAIALVGCASNPLANPGEGITPPPVDGGAAAGSRLAPGLYDLEGGTVQALGTLEYRDLEGGLWAIIGGTEADGNLGEVVAVVANPDDFSAQLNALSGGTVMLTGTRSEGTSIRMAGPEIVVTAIEEISDTPGPAE
ncbi:MAG: hypothetical protein CVT66_08640 [Actinobacteria bacterium HGW-Actinobacteria-6]|nr:MAG: hypothetical protein CVT66_08640 [Actinobacteria bacterium HGW-Actinobacteria-6]